MTAGVGDVLDVSNDPQSFADLTKKLPPEERIAVAQRFDKRARMTRKQSLEVWCIARKVSFEVRKGVREDMIENE